MEITSLGGFLRTLACAVKGDRRGGGEESELGSRTQGGGTR